MTLMTTSNRGRDLIKEFEGLSLKAYLCPAGRWTIGYGHTAGVRKGQVITQDDAGRMLADDCHVAERTLNALGVNFRQEQFDALVSWIFNLGTGSFSTSTLRKRILAGAADEQVADEMVRWVNASGKPMPGLMRRRAAEANMFLGRERYKVSNNRIVKI